MNERTTPSGWTKRHDGAWEALIDGTTYLIDREDDMYYVYRSLGWEQVDAASTLIDAMVKAEA
jgi:hypothetical protein